MKLPVIFALIVWFGSLNVAHAESTAAKDPLLPPVKLDGYLKGYSVQLNTDQPNSSTVGTPAGLTTLKKHETQPFYGLKFTKPLN